MMRSLRLSDRRRLIRRVVLVCLLLAGGVFLTWAHGDLDRAERWTEDLRFQWRGPVPARGDIAVIGIDDVSLHNLGQVYGSWPWPRSVHAKLIERLTQAGARVIALDIIFAEPDHHGGANDARLARALRRSGRVLLAMQYAPPARASVAAPLQADPAFLDSADVLRARSARAPAALPGWLQPPKHEYFWVLPEPVLARAALGFGFVDLDPDADGVFRRAPPVQAVDSRRLYAHLGVAAAAAALSVPLDEIRVDGARQRVRLGHVRSLPVDANGWLAINFAGGATRRAGEGRRELLPSAFPYYSYATVLEGHVPPAAFRDKIVFIGATAKGLTDVRPTPFDPEAGGVELSANLTDAILANRLAPPLPPLTLPAIMLGLTLLLCLALTARTPAVATAATLAIALPYLAGALLLFARTGLQIPVFTPMLTVAACYTGVMTLRFATEQREQRRVRRFLERYVTREVADRVLEDPEAAQMGGKRREVTMLFSDIRGFTSMSEKLPAEVVIRLLNEYFAVMVPIIERHRGTVNNFIGDAIFAFWGAPLAQSDQAERAVTSGLEMLEALPPLQARWREQGLPAFEIGIGIHLGAAVAGNIGTERRCHYTVIGDDVNIASRLEGANSREGTKFLISDAVYARVAGRIEARRLPPLSVKNKAEPLSVYEVLGRRGSIQHKDTETPGTGILTR